MAKNEFQYANDFCEKFPFLNLPQSSIVVALSVAALVMPVFFHSQSFPNQLIVGTVVNTLLALCALFLTFRNSLPVILIPSIAALISGYVFGSFTIFLAFLIPFIWAGNALYVYAIKRLRVVGGINYGVSVLAASFLKAALIGGATLVLVSIGVVPAALLVPMGVVQFATAVVGGLVAGAALFVK